MATYRHCDLKSHWRPRQLIYMHTPIENVKLTSSSGKLLFLCTILGGSRCRSTIEFRAVFRLSVVIVKNISIACHSFCIENSKSDSDHRSERKLDSAVCFFALSLCKNTKGSLSRR